MAPEISASLRPPRETYNISHRQTLIGAPQSTTISAPTASSVRDISPFRISRHSSTHGNQQPSPRLCVLRVRHTTSRIGRHSSVTVNQYKDSAPTACSVRDKRYPLSLKQRHRQITPGLRHQRVIVTECRKERQQRLAGCIILPVALGRDQC
jgi:hypothetical protein